MISDADEGIDGLESKTGAEAMATSGDDARLVLREMTADPDADIEGGGRILFVWVSVRGKRGSFSLCGDEFTASEDDRWEESMMFRNIF